MFACSCHSVRATTLTAPSCPSWLSETGRKIVRLGGLRQSLRLICVESLGGSGGLYERSASGDNVIAIGRRDTAEIAGRVLAQFPPATGADYAGWGRRVIYPEDVHAQVQRAILAHEIGHAQQSERRTGPAGSVAREEAADSFAGEVAEILQWDSDSIAGSSRCSAARSCSARTRHRRSA